MSSARLGQTQSAPYSAFGRVHEGKVGGSTYTWALPALRPISRCLVCCEGGGVMAVRELLLCVMLSVKVTILAELAACCANVMSPVPCLKGQKMRPACQLYSTRFSTQAQAACYTAH